ncbi:hypothetical protein ACQP1W_29425 [Spirillospora sp. CA-255316]
MTEPARRLDASHPEVPWLDEDADMSFLAPLEKLVDWRLALAYDAAAEAGVLAALPGAPFELAERCDLDEGALRAVLGQLTAGGDVALDEQGRYSSGPHAPAWPHDAMLRRHDAAIRRWGALLNAWLRDRTASGDRLPSRPALPETGQATLAVRARPLIGPVVDLCPRAFPAARRVLDLGGGHGQFSLEFARRGLETTMQDLPEVVEIACRRGRLPAAGGRCRAVRR